MKRDSLKSRLGFLMLSAGCAVGLGNVWRFPFIVGQNGGAAFVLVGFRGDCPRAFRRPLFEMNLPPLNLPRYF